MIRVKSNKKGLTGTQTAIVVAVVVIIVIAAIGIVLVSSHHKTSTPSSVTVPPTTTHTPVTITVWDTYDNPENMGFNKTLAAFEAAYPWIHVDVTYGVQVSTSNFETAAKAGDAPIVYRDTSNDAGALFAAGLLLNLSAYLNNSVYSNYLPVAVKNFELNGSVYGLPDDINYILMFYNKHFVPYPPNTTQQLIQIAEQVNETYHIWGIAYGVSSEYGYRFAAWYAGFGGQIFNSQGIPTMNNSAMVNALEFWYNLTYIDHINAPDMTPSLEQQLFTHNEAAIIFDGPWDLAIYNKSLGPLLGAAPLPVVSQTGMYAEPFLGSTGWVISSPKASGATPAQIQAALLFIQFVTGENATLNLWKYAYDIPAQVQAYNQVVSQLKAGQITPSYLAGILEGVLAQAQHTQPFPNIPQMNYYWPGFHQYATEYYANRTITAQQAAQGMESYILQQMEQNGLLPAGYLLMGMFPAVTDVW
ncbi:sugar ABC transporter substrate-binding protein [Sulfolobales archaeon HS-7]|nr:sugar ABC transporter substrate-binding protein [Sulfolobales archaeon HS-7]